MEFGIQAKVIMRIQESYLNYIHARILSIVKIVSVDLHQIIKQEIPSERNQISIFTHSHLIVELPKSMRFEFLVGNLSQTFLVTP